MGNTCFTPENSRHSAGGGSAGQKSRLYRAYIKNYTIQRGEP